MEKRNLKRPILKSLEKLELSGITFIRDYVQFLFDGSVFNASTFPQIRIDKKVINSTDIGYCDTLRSLINKKILFAKEDKQKEKIVIRFENDVELMISLKLEDRSSAEAAMLQLETDGEWNVW